VDGALNVVVKEDFYTRVTEFKRIVKWWCSRSPLRYSKVKHRFGKVDVFINEVWIQCVVSFADNSMFMHTFGTHVINSCAWCLAKPIKKAAIPLEIAEHIGRKQNNIITHTDKDRSEGEFRYAFWKNAKNVLTKRQFYIVWHLAGVGIQRKTIAEITKHLGISRSYVFQIMKQSVRRLHKKGVLDALEINMQKVRSQKIKGEYAHLLLEHVLDME
jgi:maltooligosyltrehalose synthase